MTQSRGGLGRTAGQSRGGLGRTAGQSPRFRRASGVLERVVDEEVLVATADSEVASLRGSAFRQWLLLDRPRTIDDLAAQLARIYDVDAGDIRSEVGDLLEDLRGRGLVEVISSE
ncbi:MAG: PqqD family protein [Actinomycetota bacterium]